MGLEEQNIKNGQSVILDSAKGRLGTSFKSYDLKFTFGKGVSQMGNDRFSEVYFRTHSGNIYRLDSEGRLIDSRSSREKGKVIKYDLPADMLAEQRIDLGSRFLFGHGRTSSITEIVCATSHMFGANSSTLWALTDGRQSSIVKDFEEGMPKDFRDYQTY